VKIGIDGHDFGWLQMLFPAVLFGLETLEPEGIVKFSDSNGEKNQTAAVSEDDLVTDVVENAVPGADKPRGQVGDVLIISDADPEVDRIKEMLGSQGISVVQLNFRDNLMDYLPGAYQAVLLVMNDVDERSLGVAIKISTCCSLPLIASGSSWTRSKVFKAVKYGVSDILLTPATEDDISSKISGYITSQAA
jgi:PleD family two-component response regulator